VSKKVAIIGASSAGLFTAHLLARHGLQVEVYEAAEPIKPPKRTLIVTDHFLRLTGPLGADTVVNKINRFELFADGKVASVRLARPDLVIERSALVEKLVEQARESGAHIFAGHRFNSMELNGGTLRFTVVRNNGNTQLVNGSADVLVGADGAFSRVARTAGWPQRKTLPLIQALVKLPKDMSVHTTRVWFLPEETPYFFWLIPHSSMEGALGLIAEDERLGRLALERFLRKKGLQPLEFQSARTPFYSQWVPYKRKIGRNDVYLVGDAGGHVKVSTVGGVVTGLRGALGVAEAILNGGHSSELRALRQELGIHRLIRSGLNGFSQDHYARLLDLVNSSVNHLLSWRSRDEARKLVTQLFLKEPRLLFLGLRGLVQRAIFASGR